MKLSEFLQTKPVDENTMIFPLLVDAYPIEVNLGSTSATDFCEVSSWINDTFHTLEFVEISYRFFFNSDYNALQFKLVWGGSVVNHN